MKILNKFIIVERMKSTDTGMLQYTGREENQLQYQRGKVLGVSDLVDTVKIDDVILYDKTRAANAQVGDTVGVVLQESAVVLVFDKEGS